MNRKKISSYANVRISFRNENENEGKSAGFRDLLCQIKTIVVMINDDVDKKKWRRRRRQWCLKINDQQKNCWEKIFVKEKTYLVSVQEKTVSVRSARTLQDEKWKKISNDRRRIKENHIRERKLW